MRSYLIGIDIGGTSIKFGILKKDGELIHKWNIPTDIKDNGSIILASSWTSIQKKLTHMKISKNQILGIGIGIPGYTDSKQGIIYEAINIGWKNKNIIQELHALTGLPAFVENDANVAALGEYWQGAGQGVEHLITVTLGTGVGGGIISNGRMINGISSMAGELGHILIEEDGAPCNCGNYGCLETIASATGIVREAKELIATQPTSSLARFYKEKRVLTSQDVFQLAEDGDLNALQVVNRVAQVLGQTFANLGVIVNPEIILISGGVSQAGQSFLEKIQTCFHRYALARVKKNCAIKLAELGNDAGIIGAAYLVKKSMK